MDRENARSILRTKLKDYVERCTEKSKGTNKYVCPFCNSGRKGDNTGAFTVHKDGWVCFSCGRTGDIFKLVGELEHLPNFKEQLEYLANLYGIQLDDLPKQDKTEQKTKYSVVSTQSKKEEPEQPETDYSDFFLQANKNINETDYYRGISLDTLNRFHVGYVSEWRHPKVSVHVPTTPRLIIPTSKYSYLARDTRLGISPEEKKYSKSKVGKVHMLNADTIKTAEHPIFIVEGEIDAMSIIDLGYEAVALGSISNIDMLMSYVKENKPKSTLILALDNDTPKGENDKGKGQQAQERLAEALKDADIEYRTVSHSFYCKYKDANEFFMSDKNTFKQNLQQAVDNTFKSLEELEQIESEERKEAERKELSEENAYHYSRSFWKHIFSDKTTSIPTGFTNLDKLLDGGLYSGLYVVGAISSFGKTTFCMQMADQIAESGRDVLIFSLEMSKFELMAKSCSRLSFLKSKSKVSVEEIETNTKILDKAKYAYSTRNILNWGRKTHSTNEDDLLSKVLQTYDVIATHIYIVEGQGDVSVKTIREKVQRHYNIMGQAPIVLIDYLQILSPYDVKATDKQNTDKAVLELKKISRDFDTPVIAISSFNRDNYTAPVNLASFKESGAIEYSSDVLIGLQYSGCDKRNAEDISKLIEEQKTLSETSPRQIEVKILKNRNGLTNSVQFNFYSMFNCFEER